MSAVNIIIEQRDAVHFITDTAVCDSSGEVQFFRPKVMALPLLPAVIATRGSARALDLLGVALGGEYRTFDELVDGIEDFFPRVIDRHGGELGDVRTELYVGGWSKQRNAFEAYQIISTDNAPYKLDAMTLYPLTDVTVGPPIDEEPLLHARNFGPQLNSVDDIDPARHGQMFLELQRQNLADYHGTQAHWIGGEALLTTVTKEGVSQRVIHRWAEDEPGEMIKPYPINWKQWWAARTPKFEAPAGMSRAKAELMKRKAAKGKLAA